MRDEIINFKNKIKKEYEEQLILIDQLGDQLIIINNKIKGICKCNGKGGYGIKDGKYCRCKGDGLMEINCQYDPCGKNDYEYTTCSNLHPIPQIFKDFGEGI